MNASSLNSCLNRNEIFDDNFAIELTDEPQLDILLQDRVSHLSNTIVMIDCTSNFENRRES